MANAQNQFEYQLHFKRKNRYFTHTKFNFKMFKFSYKQVNRDLTNTLLGLYKLTQCYKNEVIFLHLTNLYTLTGVCYKWHWKMYCLKLLKFKHLHIYNGNGFWQEQFQLYLTMQTFSASTFLLLIGVGNQTGSYSNLQRDIDGRNHGWVV